jgi:hypothetical protein
VTRHYILSKEFILNSNTFYEINKIHENAKPNDRIWTNELAVEYGYPSSEAMRSAYRRAKKVYGAEKTFEIKNNTGPRIGIIDIETLPMEVYSFGLFDQNIGINQIISDMCVLSWAGKFLNESEIYGDILTSKEAPKKDDKRIVASSHDFLSKCDIVIGHNLISFDGKILNTQFLLYDMMPIKYVSVDTLIVAKNNFRFSSNKLAFINQKLGIRNKIDNEGFVLWSECHKGNKESLDEMMKYNIGDVLSTETLFYKIRPYVKNFNVALYNEINEYQCPVCGSTNLNVEGYKYLSAGKYESVRCIDCGCISRKRENLLDKKKRKSLLSN